MANLSSPWIEAFTIKTIKEHTTTALPQVVQITQATDDHLQTFVSDGTHLVFSKLPKHVKSGLYRITSYEIIVEDASDKNSWNRLKRCSAVFPLEAFSITLSIQSLHNVGHLLDDDRIIGDPRVLIHSVNIRRVLRLPRGTLASAGAIDAVVAATAPAVPLGNVAHALASDDLISAIQQSIQLSDEEEDGDAENTSMKTSSVSSARNKHPNTTASAGTSARVEADTPTEDTMERSTPAETTTAQAENDDDDDEDMGIDAMLVDDEEEGAAEQRDSPEAREDDQKMPARHERMNDDENSDATPTIQNYAHVVAPPRMAHHGGETIRAWMTADSPVSTPTRKPAFGKEAFKYAGDSIRAWLLSSDLRGEDDDS